MNGSVFVCYSRKDEAFVLELARRLKERSVNVWIDQWDIAPSADWDCSIDEALEECSRVLIVLSPNAAKSDVVRGELHVALQVNKPVVPVLYRPGWIPRQLLTVEHVDFTSGGLDDGNKLASLATALGGTASPGTQEPRAASLPQMPPQAMRATESQEKSLEPPRVFLSYAHETPMHIEWVRSMTKDMRSRGVDALLDQWRVPYGGDFTIFMDSMRTCNRVLLVCTPAYARKANEGHGGVGYERQIITGELAKTIMTTTFVCVWRSGLPEEAIPTFASARRYFDFRNDAEYEQRLEELLRDFHGVPLDPEPPIGPKPYFAREPDGMRPATISKTASVEMDLTLNLGGGVILELVRIPAGEFLMGSPEREEHHLSREAPQHPVPIERAFYLGKYAVTQAQWRAVMGDSPSHFKGDDRPVEQVSWKHCQRFCGKLSRRVGREVRLPSEAEWEYACRARTRTPYYFGWTISTNQANYGGEGTTAVGSFPANAFGLFDMHSNVWEWCEDVWHDDYEGAPSDGSAWTTGGTSGRRVLRGGSWLNYEIDLRSAFRGDGTTDFRYGTIGFRVAVEA